MYITTVEPKINSYLKNNKVDSLEEADKLTKSGKERSGIINDGVRQTPGGVKMMNAIKLSY